MLIKWIPENTSFDFVRLRYASFILSTVLALFAVGLLFSKGLNYGIDFSGGTLIEVQVPDQAPELGALRNTLNDLKLGSISIQEFGSPNDLMIRMPEQEGDAAAQQAAIAQVRGALDAKYEKVDYRRIEFVGPQVGKELKEKGAFAVLFALIGMLVYVWFRFEWQYGVSACIALIHDTFITVGLFSLTGMEFNLSTVAAILMIAGYSMNDTVVVFDRIREDLRKYKKMPMAELLNKAINQTLSRTLMTSGTTILALVALWLFGGEVIRGFVYALIFGIAIGTYSSIFVAAPMLMFVNIRAKKKNNDESESKTA